MIRLDYTQNMPYQGIVLIDETGDYKEAFENVTDPRLLNSLQTIKNANHKIKLESNLLPRKIFSYLFPFTPTFTQPQFIPTHAFELMDVLFKYFPKHHLILSDFSELGDSVEGVNAPVVQTRYQGTMVPCSTYLVQPGWFDIFFPTDFKLFKSVYDFKRSEYMNGIACGDGSLGTDAKTNEAVSKVYTQRDFLLKYSNHIFDTTTQSGDNPMLSFYENMSFFTSE